MSTKYLFLLVICLVGSCYNPHLGDGGFTCERVPSCPSGQQCCWDLRCWSTCPPQPDGPMPSVTGGSLGPENPSSWGTETQDASGLDALAQEPDAFSLPSDADPDASLPPDAGSDAPVDPCAAGLIPCTGFEKDLYANYFCIKTCGVSFICGGEVCQRRN